MVWRCQGLLDVPDFQWLAPETCRRRLTGLVLRRLRHGHAEAARASHVSRAQPARHAFPADGELRLAIATAGADPTRLAHRRQDGLHGPDRSRFLEGLWDRSLVQVATADIDPLGPSSALFSPWRPVARLLFALAAGCYSRLFRRDASPGLRFAAAGRTGSPLTV